jgi:hypothetical protein
VFKSDYQPPIIPWKHMYFENGSPKSNTYDMGMTHKGHFLGSNHLLDHGFSPWRHMRANPNNALTKKLWKHWDCQVQPIKARPGISISRVQDLKLEKALAKWSHTCCATTCCPIEKETHNRTCKQITGNLTREESHLYHKSSLLGIL